MQKHLITYGLAIIGLLGMWTTVIGVQGAEPLAVPDAAAAGAEIFPKPDWKDTPDPLASPDAVPGGDITFFLAQEPSSLNGYLDSFAHVQLVFGMMYETLLTTDSVTLADTPNLAEKWSLSQDKKTISFWVDQRARWSDGQPVTAQDVKATFEAIMASPRTGPTRLFLSRFEPPTVTGKYQVTFTSKTVHWNNLNVLGSFDILPAHVLEKTKLEDQHFEFPVTSGPYRIGERRPGQHVTMTKRQDWWQQSLPRTQYTYNFESIKFKFFAQRNNALEAFKKGEIDIYAVYTSRIWVEETRGEKFDKNWIVKQRIFNAQPAGFQGFAMNMRRAPYDDVRVRQALGHLVDRQKMNELLMYNLYALHKSYFEDLYTAAEPALNPFVQYDVDKARALLKEAGWAVNPATGKLEKDGTVFSITFLMRDATFNRFLAIYQESLKQVGIEVVIDLKDVAAWAKDMDAFNFDMTMAAWGGAYVETRSNCGREQKRTARRVPTLPAFRTIRLMRSLSNSAQSLISTHVTTSCEKLIVSFMTPIHTRCYGMPITPVCYIGTNLARRTGSYQNMETSIRPLRIGGLMRIPRPTLKRLWPAVSPCLKNRWM